MTKKINKDNRDRTFYRYCEFRFKLMVFFTNYRFLKNYHFRTAIEAQLLGARTVIVERRPKFTRNNVLKLWKFLIHDLKSLGAKKFYGKFATGTINHINIRQLQLILTKICLMLGVHVYIPCHFMGISEPVLQAGRQNIDQ